MNEIKIELKRKECEDIGCVAIRKFKKWNKEEVNFIKENYKNKRIIEIAFFLKRSINSIRRKACKLKLTKLREIQGYDNLGLQYIATMKVRAKKKGLEFDLDINYIRDLLIKQNYKCKLSGLKIEEKKINGYRTASIDRIDSSKGYIKGNVQWLHKNVNFMKLSLTNEQFINFCKTVCEFNKII